LRNEHRSDGEVATVDPEAPELLDGCYLRCHLDGAGRVSRLVWLGLPDRESTALPLWFVEVREAAVQPPAVNLLAFQGHGQADGTLLDEAAASNLDLTSADQLGAVRWWPGTGAVDQIYVAPKWRRHRIGTVLVYTAGALSIVRGWPRAWTDGQRTKLGEAFVQASLFRGRAEPLTHLLGPMTPPEQAPG
jgi:GNAT superfamily N-acetyltransferase